MMPSNGHKRAPFVNLRQNMIRQANMPAVLSDGFVVNRAGNRSIQFDDDRSSQADVYDLRRPNGVSSPNIIHQHSSVEHQNFGAVEMDVSPAVPQEMHRAPTGEN